MIYNVGPSRPVSTYSFKNLADVPWTPAAVKPGGAPVPRAGDAVLLDPLPLNAAGVAPSYYRTPDRGIILPAACQLTGLGADPRAVVITGTVPHYSALIQIRAQSNGSTCSGFTIDAPDGACLNASGAAGFTWANLRLGIDGKYHTTYPEDALDAQGHKIGETPRTVAVGGDWGWEIAGCKGARLRNVRTSAMARYGGYIHVDASGTKSSDTVLDDCECGWSVWEHYLRVMGADGVTFNRYKGWARPQYSGTKLTSSLTVRAGARNVKCFDCNFGYGIGLGAQVKPGADHPGEFASGIEIRRGLTRGGSVLITDNLLPPSGNPDGTADPADTNIIDGLTINSDRGGSAVLVDAGRGHATLTNIVADYRGNGREPFIALPPERTPHLHLAGVTFRGKKIA